MPPPVLESRQSSLSLSFVYRFKYAPPGFGIKAKRIATGSFSLSEYAPPGFGIKAKHDVTCIKRLPEYAPPGFGIKAKPMESEK